MAYRIRGTVLPDGDVREVFVDNGRLTFQGVDDAETLLDDCVLIPGLVDVHAHLTMSFPPPDAGPEERAATSAKAHLDAGVLLIREPGSPEARLEHDWTGRASSSCDHGRPIPRPTGPRRTRAGPRSASRRTA
jgi:hypothetical protein